MEKTLDQKVATDAQRAINYDLKARHGGGNPLTHKPSCYGIALKWIIGLRKITLAQFAKMYNGTTAQNINYFLNRVTKDRFFDENVEKMCEVLGLDLEYFVKLVEEIEKLMEK